MTEYLQHWLSRAAASAPTIGRVLASHGQADIQGYIQSLAQTVPEPYQCRSDVAQAASEYCGRLLGPELAARLYHELQQQPLVLTTNHHGVDFFAQSVQGSLCLGLRQIGQQAAKTVPVFACGSVAMNNLTYPRGMMVYQTLSDTSPLRLPVFPDRVKRQLVSRTAALTGEMIQRAEKRLQGLLTESRISESVHGAGAEVLRHCYGQDQVLNLGCYSDQAVLINHTLWQSMFPDAAAGQLVYLELERVAEPLIQRDLADQGSLLSLLLFDNQIRSCLIDSLLGIQGCWHFAERFKQLYDQGQSHQSTGQGTFMFWGVDGRNRRFALAVDRENGQYVLRAIDASVNWSRPLTAEALREALSEGHILPSLFTCYSVISLARGIICAGGYYQADYLPRIQRGIVRALGIRQELAAVAAAVAGVPTTAYLAGMQAVLCRHQQGLSPAGPLEMIAAGGLRADALQQVAGMSVLEAHLASLSETLPDLLGREADFCQQTLARELSVLTDSSAVRVQTA